MDESIHRGNISYINHEKHFATIDYTSNNKKKSVNCKTNEQGKSVTGAVIKRHVFRLGDVVDFQLKLSDRGDKLTAYNIKFLYNTSLEQLINKAAVENRFSGYFKIVDEKFFVKEWDSYLFFPLQLSPWEKPPVESAANEAITFRLINLDKPNRITAELFSHTYLPEYLKATQYFNDKKEIDAVVAKVSPYGIYLNLFSDKVQAKLPVSDGGEQQYKEGDPIRVIITHLGPSRIVVEKV